MPGHADSSGFIGRQSAAWRRVALSVCVWLLMLPSLGVAVDDRAISDFEHTRWTREDGFPGQVSAIAQTRDGYLWLASGQSLYRFDGKVLERYRTADGNTLPMVSALVAHPDGSLWVGLRHGGVVRLVQGQSTRFGVAQGIPSGIPHDMVVDRAGQVIVAVADQLVTGGVGGFRAVALDGATGNPGLRSLLVDRTGGVWVGGTRLWHRAPGQARFMPSRAGAEGVVALAEAPDGRIWVAESAPSRVRALVGDVQARVSGTLPSAPTALAFDRDGGLWVGTTGDGVRYAPAPGGDDDIRPSPFTVTNGLSGDVVARVVRDREGNLWLGTNAGLDRFRQSDLVKVGFPSGAHNFALVIDGQNAVWAGSMNRNAMRLSGQQLATTTVPYPVTVAHRRPDGQVWLAGPGGFWRSNGSRVERVMGLPEGIAPPAVVRAIVEDRDGTVWASINDHGLYRWRDGMWSRQPTIGTLPSQRMPVRAERGRDGGVWFGYRDNLLVGVQDGRIRAWGPREGLDVGHVTALLVTDTRFWVGGSKGLSLFDGKRFVPLRLADGYRISGVHGLVETVTGELWLHGNDGVLRLDAEQIARFIRNPQTRLTPRSLWALEPLADDVRQLRPLPTAVAGADGNVWLATSLGVRRVDPRRVAMAEVPPPAHVVSLRADDGPLQPVVGARLPEMTRRVVVAYTSTGLKAPEAVRFRYRIRGVDGAWHDAGAAREATYVGLPPGRFEFELSAAYGDGAWGTPTVASFEILPAFHQTRTFIALCALLLVAMLWLAHRMRVRYLANALRTQLDVRHRERTRIARELHDTLLQSVQGLILRFQAAANRLPPDAPERDVIERALVSADQVIAEGRDRVTELRLGERTPGELIPALESVGNEMAGLHGARFSVIVQDAPPPLPAAVEEELFHITREALINAFRHANARVVSLQLEHDHALITLRVRDDGVGLPPSVMQERSLTGHWGLIGMRERAERIGAALEIRSSAGAGTDVEVKLRLHTLPGRADGNARWRRWFKRPG